MRCLKKYDVIDEALHWEKIERGKKWRKEKKKEGKGGREKEGGKRREGKGGRERKEGKKRDNVRKKKKGLI